MRRLISAVLVLAFAVAVSPMQNVLAQGQAAATTSRIVGVAKDSNGNVLANHTVHLRNAAGEIVQTVTSAADGSFSFSGLAAGNYTVQLATSTGAVIGTSAGITVVAGTTTTVAVTAAAVAVAAAAAGLSTAMIAAIVGGAVVTATVIGVAVNNSNSSPSR